MLPSADRPATDDPRPQFAAALDQLDEVVRRIGTDDLARPTPCGDFDVATLLAHLVAVLRKLAVATRGGDMTTVDDPATDTGGNAARALGTARAELDALWADGSERLDETLTVAWGSMTGRELLDAYSHEFTVHAWDLTRVVGGREELDPGLAAAALDWFTRFVPADDRAAGGPFGPVVAVPDDADVHTRLAGFVGRDRQWLSSR